jgi:hypothetical protein
MPKNRAERRHHEKRIRNRVRTFLKEAWRIDRWYKERDDMAGFEKKVCKMAQARKPCSCHMCCSPRKNGELPLQELRVKESERYDDLQD